MVSAAGGGSDGRAGSAGGRCAEVPDAGMLLAADALT
jgi:hypothetical protein